MAGITLEQAQAKLDLWMAAEQAKLDLWMAADDAIANGQAYTIGGRSLTRADADIIDRKIEKWDRRVKQLTRQAAGGGIRARRVTFV